MFEEILNKTKQTLATIRAVIQTKERLIKIAFGRENETVKQLQNNRQSRELLEGLPSRVEWEDYEHCAVVTRLYAIYESFVENLIKEWLKTLPQLIPRYSNLEKQIQNTHREGVGRLLLELNKKKFKHLSPDTVVKGIAISNQM